MLEALALLIVPQKKFLNIRLVNINLWKVTGQNKSSGIAAASKVKPSLFNNKGSPIGSQEDALCFYGQFPNNNLTNSKN